MIAFLCHHRHIYAVLHRYNADSRKSCAPGGRLPYQSQRERPLGFSLVELICVAAILMILAALYYGRSSGDRQRELRAKCSQNLQQIYISVQLYANEEQGRTPVVLGARTSAAALALLVPRYTSATRSFICPGAKDPKDLPVENFARQTISYSYYMGQWITNANGLLLTDQQVNTQAKSSGQLVFSTDGKGRGNNHHSFGGNLLFADGRVETIGPRTPQFMPITPAVKLLNP